MSLPMRQIVYFLTGLGLCLLAAGLQAGEIHDAASAGDLDKVGRSLQPTRHSGVERSARRDAALCCLRQETSGRRGCPHRQGADVRARADRS